MGHPAPTFETFNDVIYDGLPTGVLDSIQPDLKRFFVKEWDNYAATRNAIKWRIQLLLENDLFRAMFSSPKTKFNIARAMDSGLCVVVDNSQAKLGPYGSAFLGRFFLSRIWSAATQRHLVPEHCRKPVCVYVDECQILLDQTCAKIIDECRSAKIALLLSHQRSSQIPDTNVRGALENCAIKMVNVSHGEIDYFSKLLNIPPERMKDLPLGHFATDIRFQGARITKIDDEKIPFRLMNSKEETEFKARIKKEYGIETQTAPAKSAEVPPAKVTPIITHEAPARAEASKPGKQSVPEGNGHSEGVSHGDPSKPATWKRN